MLFAASVAHSISDRGEKGMSSLFLGVGLEKAPTQMDSICISSVLTFAGGLLNSPLMGVASLPFAVLGAAAAFSGAAVCWLPSGPVVSLAPSHERAPVVPGRVGGV